MVTRVFGGLSDLNQQFIELTAHVCTLIPVGVAEGVIDDTLHRADEAADGADTVVSCLDSLDGLSNTVEAGVQCLCAVGEIDRSKEIAWVVDCRVDFFAGSQAFGRRLERRGRALQLEEVSTNARVE